MSDKRIVTTAGDDIHEAVQITYDSLLGSMDWGSGFLDDQEVEAVVRLAIIMGWKLPHLDGSDGCHVTTARKFVDYYQIEEVGNFYKNHVGFHNPCSHDPECKFFSKVQITERTS